jgi:3-dehydrosphinganine reductase
MSNRIFQDQVVVITGASSGIGRETALLIARFNARVVLVSRNMEKLAAVREEIVVKGGQALAIQADVSIPEDTDRVAHETLSKWGKIDILIACAGQYVQGSAHQMDIGLFEKSLTINFYGTLYMIRSVLPEFQRQGRGHIVIVNSLDSKKGIVGDAPYVVAKCALDGYGDVLRQELKGQNIGVTSIYPGRVDTPMLEHVKVPWTSGKIPPVRVAKVILKGIRKNKAVVYVAAVYRPLLAVNMFMPKFADWCYKVLKVEGEKVNP